jgi:putative phage-type endonuclease
MRRLADLTTLARADWLALRRQGLGSSDAPAVVGVSPYRTPLRLWAEKVGLLEPEETEAMRWGRLLEPVVADEYARAAEIELWAPMALYQHHEHAWMLATPDRLATQARPEVVVEIKVRGAWVDQDLPPHYVIQVQHQMAVLGLERATVVVLVAGQRLVWAHVERDDAMIRDLIEREREFWRRVELNDPPPSVAEDRTQGVLSKLYPKDSGRKVYLPYVRRLRGWSDAAQSLRRGSRRRCETRQLASCRAAVRIVGASCGASSNPSRRAWKNTECFAGCREETSCPSWFPRPNAYRPSESCSKNSCHKCRSPCHHT